MCRTSSALPFPPFPLLAKVIRKAELDQSIMILIAPRWPVQPWFLDLPELSPVSVPNPGFSLAAAFPEPTHKFGTFTLGFCIKSLQALGTPDQAVFLVGDAHSPGTQNVYAAKWDR